jgi:hypothetical protein
MSCIGAYKGVRVVCELERARARGGWHAFNQQKADMSRGEEISHMHELLADLNEMGRV